MQFIGRTSLQTQSWDTVLGRGHILVGWGHVLSRLAPMKNILPLSLAIETCAAILLSTGQKTINLLNQMKSSSVP